MPRCEDYPCCGHGPPPLGDDGGCPDENGCFNCVLCGGKLPKGAYSSICKDCRNRRANMDDDEREWRDQQQAEYDERYR